MAFLQLYYLYFKAPYPINIQHAMLVNPYFHLKYIPICISLKMNIFIIKSHIHKKMNNVFRKYDNEQKGEIHILMETETMVTVACISVTIIIIKSFIYIYILFIQA